MSAILNNIGDKFEFTLSAFINGNLAIQSYTEDLEGETSTRFFDKKFRYSFDGLSYSDWMDLTNDNINQINGYSDSILFLNFSYIRKGTDTTGQLVFNSLVLNGQAILQINTYDSTLQTLFAEIVQNDFFTQAVRNNLLRKLYNSGILPNFIERGGEGDDNDFISFWGSICGFFALITTFAEEFDNIPFNSRLLRLFLEEHNIALHKNSTLKDLQNISQNLLSQLRLRGTVMTSKEKGYKNMLSEGEWLRLISYEPSDEFLIDVERKKDNGFYLNQSSVLYPGNYRDNKQIQKFKGSFLDDENDLPEKLDDTSIAIKIAKDIDYIFELEIEKPDGVFDIKLGLVGFNSDGYKIDNSFIDCQLQTSNNYFINGTVNTIMKGGRYFIRCIIFNKNYDFTENNELSINLGNNLKQNNTIANSFLPLIVVDNTIIIKSINVRPLVKGWGVKRIKNPQFLQSLRFINNYRKNNSDKLEESFINNFIEKYLIPYHYKLNSVEIGYVKPEKNPVIPNPDTPPDTTDDRIFDETFDNTFN